MSFSWILKEEEILSLILQTLGRSLSNANMVCDEHGNWVSICTRGQRRLVRDLFALELGEGFTAEVILKMHLE